MYKNLFFIRDRNQQYLARRTNKFCNISKLMLFSSIIVWLHVTNNFHENTYFTTEGYHADDTLLVLIEYIKCTNRVIKNVVRAAPATKSALQLQFAFILLPPYHSVSHQPRLFCSLLKSKLIKTQRHIYFCLQSFFLQTFCFIFRGTFKLLM